MESKNYLEEDDEQRHQGRSYESVVKESEEVPSSDLDYMRRDEARRNELGPKFGPEKKDDNPDSDIDPSYETLDEKRFAEVMKKNS